MAQDVIQRSEATWESPVRSPSVSSSALRRECGTAAISATYRLLLGVRHRLAAATDVGSLRLCLKNPQGCFTLDPS